MTIDNFDRLGKLIIQKDLVVKKANDDSFWKIELVRRKKDNDEFKSSQLIASYNVHTYDELIEKKELIISICNATGARAYMSINRRSEHQAALDMMVKLSTLLASNAKFYMKTIYESVMSSTKVPHEKRVLIDADDLSRDEVIDLIRIVDDCNNTLTLREGCQLLPEALIDGLLRYKYTNDDNDRFYDNAICCVPTPHGWHIISKVFDQEKFVYKCIERFRKTFDVHSNNIALLYYNKDDEE